MKQILVSTPDFLGPIEYMYVNPIPNTPRADLIGMEKERNMTDREKELTAMLEKYQAIGNYDRLRELAEADKDGRCVIMPCKVGDICYEVDPGHPGAIKHTVTGTTIYNRQADGNRYMTDFVNVIIIDTWAVAEDGCEWADRYTVAEWADAPKTSPEAEAALREKGEGEK